MLAGKRSMLPSPLTVLKPAPCCSKDGAAGRGMDLGPPDHPTAPRVHLVRPVRLNDRSALDLERLPVREACQAVDARRPAVRRRCRPHGARVVDGDDGGHLKGLDRRIPAAEVLVAAVPEDDGRVAGEAPDRVRDLGRLRRCVGRPPALAAEPGRPWRGARTRRGGAASLATPLHPWGHAPYMASW